MDQIIIQQISPRYYRSTLALMNQVIEETYFLALDQPIPLDESMDFMETILSNPHSIYLIALLENEVLGIMFAIPREEGYLYHSANVGYLIAPGYRNHGLASRMMDKLIKRAQRNHHIEIFFAEVLHDNLRSIQLLEKFGFQNIGRLPDGAKIDENDYRDLLYFMKNIKNSKL